MIITTTTTDDDDDDATTTTPPRFYNVFVPTTDSVLYTHLLENLAPRKPLLFVGESGTAKTVTIQNYLGSLSSESSTKLNMNFSSRTTSLDVQTNIEANVDKRAGIKYGPPTGKKLVIFIDDMNMPKVREGQSVRVDIGHDT
jgi:dynein heavy chain